MLSSFIASLNLLLHVSFNWLNPTGRIFSHASTRTPDVQDRFDRNPL